MKQSLMIRALLIVAVLAVAGFLAYPPEEKINLGLDLQGGMHLVLQVKTEDAIVAETENTMDRVMQEFEDSGAEVERTSDTSFDLRGVGTDKGREIRDLVRNSLLGWDQRRTGDKVSFEMTGTYAEETRQLAVRQAQETIRKRVDAFGVAEPVIHEEGLGSNRIVVQLPGVDDPERIKELIKSTAFLEVRLVAQNTGVYNSPDEARSSFGGELPRDVEVMPQDVRDENGRIVSTTYRIVEKRKVITGRDLKNAFASQGDFNEPVVAFNLSPEGAKKFGDVTGESIGRLLATILDGRIVVAANIRDRITDRGIITGGFSFQEVQDISTSLRSGALPAGLTYLEERTVGPSLGRDSILKGRHAGMIGGLFVVITMLLFYRLAGTNAVLALGLNIVLVFGALSMFGATLTVPGIAGIVLTIGMAVDANVLVFERIKEELRAGRTVKSAISAGFQKALSSILDANITTLIAAVFLFLFGTGPIRGFAVTLSVGIFASVFTAVFVSRWLFDLVYNRKGRVESMSI